jgi:hypothetical protein
MRLRYSVRRSHSDQRYSIWDSEIDAVAVSEGRTFADLDMQDAFDAADKLNAAPGLQQQPPQPKDEKE